MSAPPSRPALVWLIVATIAVGWFGVATLGLLAPAIMMFDAPGPARDAATLAFALYSAMGPLAAIAGIVTGWVRAASGRRYSGLKWMIVIPVVWLVGLLGWLAVVNAFCAGQFDCQA